MVAVYRFQVYSIRVFLWRDTQQVHVDSVGQNLGVDRLLSLNSQLESTNKGAMEDWASVQGMFPTGGFHSLSLGKSCSKESVSNNELLQP